MNNLTQTNLDDLAREITDSKGLKLVGTEIKKVGGRDVILVTIQKEGGVGIDDCADVSRKLDVMIEAEGLFKGTYTLEVSSPGLTRPLRTREEFKENIGQNIKVKYFNEQKQINSLVGQLKGVNDHEIILNSSEGNIEIKIESIKSAKLELTI